MDSGISASTTTAFDPVSPAFSKTPARLASGVSSSASEENSSSVSESEKLSVSTFSSLNSFSVSSSVNSETSSLFLSSVSLFSTFGDCSISFSSGTVSVTSTSSPEVNSLAYADEVHNIQADNTIDKSLIPLFFM